MDFGIYCINNIKIAGLVQRWLFYKGHNIMEQRWVHHNCVTFLFGSENKYSVLWQSNQANSHICLWNMYKRFLVIAHMELVFRIKSECVLCYLIKNVERETMTMTTTTTAPMAAEKNGARRSNIRFFNSGCIVYSIFTIRSLILYIYIFVDFIVFFRSKQAHTNYMSRSLFQND